MAPEPMMEDTAMTLAEYEKLLRPEPTDASVASEFRKDYAAGQYSNLTKSDYHELLEKLAAELRSPSETPQQAYTRAIEMTDTGKALYKAYKSAPDTSSRLPEKHKFIAEIQKRADEKFPELRTPQQRFAHAIDGSHGRPHDLVCRLLYETSKRAPGRDDAPAPAPEAAVDVHKAAAQRAGPASMRMLDLAERYRATFPNVSREAAYTAVFTDRANVELKNQVNQEEWSLRNVGDTVYTAEQNKPYSNQHPGGSGPRPS